MSQDYKQVIAGLPGRSRQELLAEWQQHFGTPAPAGLRRELLIPMIAYRIQENLFGGLDAKTKNLLLEIAQSLENGKTPHALIRKRYKPGTVLIRTWKGKRFEAKILESGYEHGGRVYDSLSVIAREITGTQWSGPAFFGIKSKAAKR